MAFLPPLSPLPSPLPSPPATPSKCFPQMRAMRFRPCIDLHEGRVKQLVGSTLDATETPETNFDTQLAASYFAALYRRDKLPGGHVIMLGKGNEQAAKQALQEYPGGLQIGGGIRPNNAAIYLDWGASHVIVTSYVFRNGIIDWERVEEMKNVVGKKRLVLDVSCRKKGEDYFVCTDRWQKWTQFQVNQANLEKLGDFCDEVLVHAVDVEGKKQGVDLQLVQMLGKTNLKVTYAGGVRNLHDLQRVKEIGRECVDVTVGSALDIFGGELKYDDCVKWQREQERSVMVREG